MNDWNQWGSHGGNEVQSTGKLLNCSVICISPSFAKSLSLSVGLNTQTLETSIYFGICWKSVKKKKLRTKSFWKVN